ncbi:MAG: SWIM zinc finger family protein [archaeon]|nr:SWIM zinc finger family protein [archaeon]
MVKEEYTPVKAEGRRFVNSWWGRSWCANLEGYADYSNRIDRGKTYIRGGRVIDLKTSEGKVTGLVQGSSRRPYKVKIDISVLSEEKKSAILSKCGNRIENLDSLLSGDIPSDIQDIFVSHGGLFPEPSEIMFHCSCPDYAYMCKHVAAVLYGVGVRFDEDPMLFFGLRGMEVDSLIKKSIDQRLEHMLKNASTKTDRMLSEDDAMSLFGVFGQK